MRMRRRLILFFLPLALMTTTALAWMGVVYWPRQGALYWSRRIVLAAPENSDLRQEGEPAAQLLQMFGGEAGLMTVRQPERVEAFRIYDDPDDQGTSFPITAGPTRLTANDVSAMSAALVSRGSYGWDYGKNCGPDFGVCLSFFRGTDRLDVLLCFGCDILMIGHNGVITGGEDFDPIVPLLVKTVKTLFPDDEAIRSLRDYSCLLPAQ